MGLGRRTGGWGFCCCWQFPQHLPGLLLLGWEERISVSSSAGLSLAFKTWWLLVVPSPCTVGVQAWTLEADHRGLHPSVASPGCANAQAELPATRASVSPFCNVDH